MKTKKLQTIFIVGILILLGSIIIIALSALAFMYLTNLLIPTAQVSLELFLWVTIGCIVYGVIFAFRQPSIMRRLRKI